MIPNMNLKVLIVVICAGRPFETLKSMCFNVGKHFLPTRVEIFFLRTYTHSLIAAMQKTDIGRFEYHPTRGTNGVSYAIFSL